MRTIPPPPPNRVPGRIVSAGPDGLRHRLTGWRGSRWHWGSLAGLGIWIWAARALLARGEPRLPALGLDLAILVAWMMPGIALALQLRRLRFSRDLTVRPGWLRVRERQGGRTRTREYGFGGVEVLDPARARVRLLPDGPTLDLCPGRDDAHELTRRISSAAQTKEAAPAGTASIQSAGREVPV